MSTCMATLSGQNIVINIATHVLEKYPNVYQVSSFFSDIVSRVNYDGLLGKSSVYSYLVPCVYRFQITG